MFSTLQTNLKTWCERHGCQTIQFHPDRLEAVVCPSQFQKDQIVGDSALIDAWKPIFVFVDSATTEPILDKQLALADEYHRDSPFKNQFCNAPIQFQVYTEEASFSRRKVFARNVLHKSKTWNSYVFDNSAKLQTGGKAVSKNGLDAARSPGIQFEAKEFRNPLDASPQTESSKKQPAFGENPSARNLLNLKCSFVRELTASVEGQVAGSLMLNLGHGELGKSGLIKTNSAIPKARPEDSMVGVFNFQVNPDRRKQGIGTALLQAAIEYCSNLGYQHLGLFCDPEQSRFYQRLGFKQLGKLEEWKSSNAY